MVASSSALLAFASKTHPSTQIPKFIYGTAWKAEQTATLVYRALKAGFRGIDTAAQPRHYNEAGVAEGIRRAITEGVVTRKDLYIQTKFTPPSGQDPSNMPYDSSAALEDQIRVSIASSLRNFTIFGEQAYLDCLVLHSPLRTPELTREAWNVMSSYVPNLIRTIGISNTTLQVLQSLCVEDIPPSVVQNRFYPATKYEISLRKFARENKIIFQSFWTLSGNPTLWRSPGPNSRVVREMAKELEDFGMVDAEAVALYALVMELDGVSVLNGTTNERRMRGDLEGVEKISQLLRDDHEWKQKFEGWMRDFKSLIGESTG